MSVNETALAVRAPMDLTDQIEKLKKENFNVLLPMTTFASQNELFVPRLDIVVPDMEGGDFYKQSSKKVGNSWVNLMAPSGQFLNKIASAANIQWHPDKCGVVERGENYVLYKAVAAVRQADGQWRVLADEYELDLTVVEEELRLDYGEKAKTKDFQDKMKKEGRDVEYYIKRDLLQKRRHKVALAASGAMNRVIRKALTLKSTYPANEAVKPFAIARFDFQPDYNDPTVRRYASISAIQAQNDLYGQGSVAIPEDVSPEDIQQANEFMSAGNITNIDSQVVDMETGEVNPTDVIDIDITSEPEPEPIGCEECASMIESFTDGKGKVWEVSDIIDHTQEKYGKKLCKDCLLKAQKAAKEAEKAKQREGK